MKCPKCGYVGFEALDRCRHCGYDFSMSPAASTPLDPPPLAAAAGATADVGPEELFGAGARDDQTAERLGFIDVATMHEGRAAETPAPAADLPLAPPVRADLFGDVPPPPAPPPLAVRKAPDRPRPRTTQVFRKPAPSVLDVASGEPPAADAPRPAAVVPLAPLWRRAMAAGLDLAVLVGIDSAVLYLTLRLLGLTMQDAAELPVIPFAAYVLGMNVAYVGVFTANGGQTLGKMLCGVRAVGDGGAISFGQALLRTVVAMAGGAMLGIGFLPILFGGERRAVHDRLAGTRVVRADA